MRENRHRVVQATPSCFDVQRQLAYHTLTHKHNGDLETAKKLAFSAFVSVLFWFCTSSCKSALWCQL